MEFLWHVDEPSFLDEIKCADDVANPAADDGCASQGNEMNLLEHESPLEHGAGLNNDAAQDDLSQERYNSLLECIMGDDISETQDDVTQERYNSLLESILGNDCTMVQVDVTEKKCSSLFEGIMGDDNNVEQDNIAQKKCNSLLEEVMDDDITIAQDNVTQQKCSSLLEEAMGGDGNCAQYWPDDLGSFFELFRAPSECGSSQDAFSEFFRAPSECGSSQDAFSELFWAPSDCGSSQDTFSKLFRAPSECGSSQDTFSELPKAQSNCGSGFYESILSRLPFEKTLPPVKCAGILRARKVKLSVPRLPEADCNNSIFSVGSNKRKFVPQELGAGLIARVAPVLGAFKLIPLSRAKAMAASAATLPRKVFVPELANAVDRARRVTCKQRRFYARLRLNDKRYRWRAATTTIAAADVAQSNDKKVAKYPKRQRAAKCRSRMGGKFQKENKSIFLPASQL